MLIHRSLLIRGLDWLLLRGLLGIRVAHKERVPSSGSAIVIANHNSHLDPLVLATLFPWSELPRLRPVAAVDYFHRNRVLKWLTSRFIRALAIPRQNFRPSKGDPLHECHSALDQGAILLFFPEGTRGKPGLLSDLKPGIAHLARRHPDVPVVPVILEGLGDVLPKGKAIPKRAPCGAQVLEPMYWCGDKSTFMERLRGRFARP